MGYANVNDNATFTAANIDLGLNWGDNVTDYGVGNFTVAGAGAVVTITGAGTGRGPVTGTEYPNSLIIGSVGGVGFWNQNAGTTTSTNPVILGEYDWYTWDDPAGGGGGQSPGAGTLNLNGGMFMAPSITTRSLVGLDPPGVTTGVVNFNGGVLQATAASTDFIATDTANASMTLNVQDGGALIDVNGFDIAINQSLNGVGTGGLEVMNSDTGVPGTLKLTNALTYTGATLIDADATLVIENGLTSNLSTISGAGDLIVSGASTMVNATSIDVGSLTITSAGRHGGGSSRRHFTGSRTQHHRAVGSGRLGDPYGLASEVGCA